jgi:hypothetical protein
VHFLQELGRWAHDVRGFDDEHELHLNSLLLKPRLIRS